MATDKEQDKTPWGWMFAGGTLAISGLLGFGYWMSKKSKNKGDTQTPPIVNASIIPSTKTVSRNDHFPLKKTSFGNRVSVLQQALVDAYGSSILPKWGVDKDWGSETDAALIKKGYPTNMDASTYNDVLERLAKVKASSIDHRNIGMKLRSATIANDFGSVKLELSKMNSTNDYSQVSNVYKTMLINGVRKTLVNGLLDQFKQSTERSHIQNEFLRMGLRESNGTWSLSGLGSVSGRKIKTKHTSNVWDDQGTGIAIPKGTVLGKELQTRNGVTMFEGSLGNTLYVHTSAVRYV